MPVSRKPLENTYRLSNGDYRLTRDEVDRALHDPEYLMSNFTQIVNKGTQTVPFAWNDFQKEYANTLFPLVNPATRLNRKHYVVVVKPRQVGATVFTTAFINLLCSYVEGINNLGILHVLPVQGTISALARDKIEPIITGVHPNLFPEVYKKNDQGTLVYEYNNIKGNRRNNIYELVSSNTKAVRGTTKNMVLLDECGFYNNPEDLEAAILPSVPSYGFSLIIYLSTFEDKRNTYFMDKIQTALQNPEDYTILFIPWYKIYPEAPDRRGINFDSLVLTQYDNEVLVPELQNAGLPRERWGDAIDWYHRTLAGFSGNMNTMKKEYPTTLDELLESGKTELVFPLEDIEFQEKQVMKDCYYQITEDLQSKRPQLTKTDLSPVKVFKNPAYGRRYVLCVDPITAVGADTDNFAASMFDRDSLEQVATIHGRDLPLEDWAQYSVALCKIYNNALICPETNMGGEYVAFVRALGYYRFYYESKTNQANKVAGIRTTVGSKDRMIRALGVLLHDRRLLLHDSAWVEELKTFELKKKVKADKTVTVKMEARNGKHDDTTATLWTLAGMLGPDRLVHRERKGFAIL